MRREPLRKFNGLLGLLGFSLRRTPPGAGATYNPKNGRWTDRQGGFGTPTQRSWLPATGRYAAARPTATTMANGMGGSTIQAGQGQGFSNWAKDNRWVNRSGQRPFSAWGSAFSGTGTSVWQGLNGAAAPNLALSAPLGDLRKDASSKAAAKLAAFAAGRDAVLRGDSRFVARDVPQLRGGIAALFGARRGIVQHQVGARGVVQWGQHDRATGQGFGVLHSTVGRIDKDGLSLDEAKAMHDRLPGLLRDRRLVESRGSRAVFTDGAFDAVVDNRHGPEHFITMYPLDGAKAARRKAALGKAAPRDPELEAAYFAAMRPAKDASPAARKAAFARFQAVMDQRGAAAPAPEAPGGQRTLSEAELRQRRDAARSGAQVRRSKGLVSTLYGRGAPVEAEEVADAGPGPRSMYRHLRQTPRVPSSMDPAKAKQLLGFAGQRTKERLEQIREEVQAGKHDGLLRRRPGDSTPPDPRTVGMALHHARNLALHDIGVADLGFRLKEEHHGPMKGMVPLIWHARRSMGNTLRQERPGEYHAWRREFGTPFKTPKYYARGNRAGSAEGHQEGEEKKRFYRHQVLIKAAEADALSKGWLSPVANVAGAGARLAGQGAARVFGGAARWAGNAAFGVARAAPGAVWGAARLAGQGAMAAGRGGWTAGRWAARQVAGVTTRRGRAETPRAIFRQSLLAGRPARQAAVDSAERAGALRGPMPLNNSYSARLAAMTQGAQQAGAQARASLFGEARVAARNRAMNFVALRNTGIGAAAGVGTLAGVGAWRQHRQDQRVAGRRQARLAGLGKLAKREAGAPLSEAEREQRREAALARWAKQGRAAVGGALDSAVGAVRRHRKAYEARRQETVANFAARHPYDRADHERRAATRGAIGLAAGAGLGGALAAAGRGAATPANRAAATALLAGGGALAGGIIGAASGARGERVSAYLGDSTGHLGLEGWGDRAKLVGAVAAGGALGLAGLGAGAAAIPRAGRTLANLADAAHAGAAVGGVTGLVVGGNAVSYLPADEARTLAEHLPLPRTGEDWKRTAAVGAGVAGAAAAGRLGLAVHRLGAAAGRRAAYRQALREAKAQGQTLVFRGAPVADPTPRPRGYAATYVARIKPVTHRYSGDDGVVSRYALPPGKHLELTQVRATPEDQRMVERVLWRDAMTDRAHLFRGKPLSEVKRTARKLRNELRGVKLSPTVQHTGGPVARVAGLMDDAGDRRVRDLHWAPTEGAVQFLSRHGYASTTSGRRNLALHDPSTLRFLDAAPRPGARTVEHRVAAAARQGQALVDTARAKIAALRA